MHILITRPIDFGASLQEELLLLGHQVSAFPVIDIIPTPNQSLLLQQINTLNTVDISIWISRNAVKFGMPLIKSIWDPLPTLQWAAVGPGTALALQQHGITNIIKPTQPPFESEALLAALPPVSGKKIMIFRGNEGRPLLIDSLQQQGATVIPVETYQRQLPQKPTVERLARWRHTLVNVIITTSSESLSNLVQLVGADISWVKNIYIVVVGPRMLSLAKQIGFNHIVVADGADDVALIAALQTIQETHP